MTAVCGGAVRRAPASACLRLGRVRLRAAAAGRAMPRTGEATNTAPASASPAERIHSAGRRPSAAASTPASSAPAGIVENAIVLIAADTRASIAAGT